jgi:enoyl-CoA hydratase
MDVTRAGAVMEIAFNAPERRNAIDQRTHDEIVAAFTTARHEPGLRAIVFAARGKVFSAGGDFDQIQADRRRPEHRAKLASSARSLFEAVAECPIPIVVALQGDSVGLGTTLILCCDAIVAARQVRISDPHVLIGLAAGDGGCIVWPQTAGLLWAKRFLLTGDRMTAADAHRIGMITDLVDAPEEVLPAARTLAERIAALPPLAVRKTKRLLSQAMRQRTVELFEHGIEAELDTFYSEDAGEALRAMRERRRGVFVGR